MSLDPRTRLLLLLCVGTLAVALEGPVALALLAGCSAAALARAGLPRSWLLRGVVAVAASVWGTVLSQGLFYDDLPRVAALRLGPVVLWREGLQWGAVQSLRFVATLLAGVAVAATTPPDRLHAALVALRLPPALAFLGAMGLRTVPALASSVLTVRQARAARGRPAFARSPWAWLRLEVAMLRPVVARALRRAQDVAETLDARGFDARDHRPPRARLRLSAADHVLGSGVLAFTLGVLTARVLFLAYTAELLYLPALRPLYGFVRAWL